MVSLVGLRTRSLRSLVLEVAGNEKHFQWADYYNQF